MSQRFWRSVQAVAGAALAMMKSWVEAMGVMEMEAASGTLQRTFLAQTDE